MRTRVTPANIFSCLLVFIKTLLIDQYEFVYFFKINFEKYTTGICIPFAAGPPFLSGHRPLRTACNYKILSFSGKCKVAAFSPAQASGNFK
jgi:hypothetical protein